MPRTAQVMLDEFCCAFGWEFNIQSHVLVIWFGEGMIELPLRAIEESGQAADFKEFLIDKYGDPKANRCNSESPN